MASKNIDVDQIVKDALSTVAKKYPDNYKKLSPLQSAELSEAAKKTVNEFITFLNRKGKKSINDFPNNVGKEKMIKNYTFKMTVETVEGRKLAVITRDGKEFRPTIDLSTQAGVLEADVVQTASIVVECVIFLLQLIGVQIPDDQEEVNRAIDVAVNALQNSEVLRAEVDAILTAYNNGSMTGVATAMVRLVIGLFKEGDFWDIVSNLLSNMSWWEWMLTAARIAAFIVTFVATDGIAAIAELVLEIVNAGFFIAKLANISTFGDMKTAN